jgi:hypothetical protein
MKNNLILNIFTILVLIGTKSGKGNRSTREKRGSEIESCGAADRPQLLWFPEAAMRNLSITQERIPQGMPFGSDEVKWEKGRTGGHNGRITNPPT